MTARTWRRLTREEILNDYTATDVKNAREQIEAGAKVVCLTRYREDNNNTTTHYTAVMMIVDDVNSSELLDAIDMCNFGGSAYVKEVRADSTVLVKATIYID